MKKIAVITLLCIYTLATMGFTLKEFYCCGKLKNISFALKTSTPPKCSMDNSNSDRCCKNQYHLIKVKDNHVTAAKNVLPDNFVAVFDDCNLTYQKFPVHSMKGNIAYQSHAPPLYPGVPVYLSNCVFRV